jgi:tetratricopeptide (TPR) repeat protein
MIPALVLNSPAMSLDPPTGLSSLQTQLDQAINRKDPLRAQKILSGILAHRNLTLDFLMRLGMHLAEGGNYAEASRVFSRSAELYPQSFESHYNLALAELAQQRDAEASAALQAARPVNDEQRFARQYLQGKIEAARGENSAARQDLQSAFEARPNNENYALDLGLLDLETSDYRQAVSVFAKGLSRNSSSQYLALGLALGQFLAGETAASRATSERLLRQHPELSSARLLLAYSLYVEGNFTAAGAVTRHGIEAPGSHPYLDYLDAAVLLKLHSSNAPRILRELNVAEAGIPKCSLCYVAASKAHQQMQSPEDALRDLKTAVQLDPALPEAWYHLAQVEDSLGHHAEAATARSRFAKLKTERSSREDEMLRAAFMKSLSN